MWSAKIFTFFLFVVVVQAQIPNLGWCPDYQPMANFNMNRFLGQWHEAERYFTVTELGSRCVTTNYEKMPDGRVWVSNEIRSAFTGVKRVLEGQLQVVGRDGEGKLSVKYTSLPVPYDTQYSVLDTDYDNYCVMWSCSGIGPVHTQNAWVMTRERLAPGIVLQRAYGVLDKYKISRAFFVKTNQEDCTIQPVPIEAVDPTPATDVETNETKKNGAVKNSGLVENPEHKQEVGAKVKSNQESLDKPQSEKEPLTVPELIQSLVEKAKPSADHHPGHIVDPKPEAEENKEKEKPEVPAQIASEPEKPIVAEKSEVKNEEKIQVKKSEIPVADVSKVDP